jgi:hypothetical protein
MNVEIGAEAAQFLVKEYINGIAVAVSEAESGFDFCISVYANKRSYSSSLHDYNSRRLPAGIS